MEIAWSKTREQFPLSPKKIVKKTVDRLIAPAILLFFLYLIAVVPLIAVGNLLFWLGIVTLIFFLIAILFVVGTYLYQRWYFAVYFYDLTDDYIIIRKGPITPREITIPYERVQDVYVDQDIFDRMFGIYDVHLSSATVSSGMEAHIDGVEKEAADGLKKILLDTVKQKITKAKSNNSPK
jgi:membrane protein YdbS with pleckstrin-like domain